MGDIGTAYVRVAPNMTGIQGKIAAGFKGSAGPATAALGDEVDRNGGPFQNAIGRLGGIAKVGGLAIAGGIAAGAAGIGALSTKMLLAGAELEQQVGGAEAVFGDFATNIRNVALKSYKDMGLSQNEFLAGANKMGSLYQGAGINVQQSMELSVAAIQRATDVASIMGIDTTTALESVTAMAKGNFTMMDNLGVAMNDTALNAYALSKGLGKTTQEMTQAEKVGLATQLFMEKTAKFAGNYAKENETLSGSLNTTKKAFDDFLSGGNTIDNFINSLIDTIKIAVPQITNLLPFVVDSLGQLFQAVVPVIASALPKLIPALINSAKMLLQGLVAALPVVIQVLVNALPLLISAFIQIFLGIVKALPQIVQILAAAMPIIITALVTGLTAPEALQAIILGGVQLFLALIQAIPIIIPALVAAIPLIVKNIIATLTNGAFIAQMMDAGTQLMKATIQGIVSMVGAVVSASWQIIQAIRNVLSISSLRSIGHDVVSGLWEGIKDMGSWLKEKVVNFVKDKIPGPIRTALGIHSPSKVAAMLGRQVPAGLAQGIDNASGLVEKAATNMANSALSSIGSPVVSSSVAFGSAGGSGIFGAGGDTTNQSVTIENVNLGDASAVKEFFAQLNQDVINVSNGLTPIQGGA